MALVVGLAVAPLGAQGQSTSPAEAGAPGALRTFELAKPAAPVSEAARRTETFAARPPMSNELLQTGIGVGYVQGADWGSEIFATGTVSGHQVQFNTLVTRGRDGMIVDHGFLSVLNPDTQWRIEAGDVFSHLRGAARGGRVSWAARGNRRPAIAVYGPPRGAADRSMVITYRDQIQVRGQTMVDAEVASDRSYMLRSGLSLSRLDLEGFYRSRRSPLRSRDAGLSGGLRLSRGIALTGGLFQSDQTDDRSDWRTIAVRLPIAKFLDLTLERAFAGSRGTSQTTSAAMASFAAGDLRLFHRYQHGDYDFVRDGIAGSIERQQTRTMSSYSRGARLNVALQLASQRGETGQVQHWEELQVTMKLTATTTLRTVTAVPDFRNPERFQVHFRQELPKRLALQADYGRISTYQSVARELDRSRFKLMLFKTVDLATPARGASVVGRVVDDFGRGVAGARVRLGPYTVDTDGTGAYRFRHVPRGGYELSLEPHLLPADFTWDGRGEHVTLTSSTTVTRNLRVTPLNAVHGRVYVDRNRNERYDAGEGVAGLVVRLEERLTATDADGAYSFYNVWPSTYVVRLGSVPADMETPSAERAVILADRAPVTGADFRLLPKVKPVVWEKLPK